MSTLSKIITDIMACGLLAYVAMVAGAMVIAFLLGMGVNRLINKRR